MPETTQSYGTIITTAGAAVITDCILNGKMLVIAQAAAGDGGGAYYMPTVDQTALKNETWRGAIADAEVNSTVPNMFDVKIVIDDDVGGFIIREMGLYTEDGVLVAICNTPDTEKVAISGGVSGKLTMVMHILVADTSVVNFTITPSLDTVSKEDLDAAISEHNGDPNSHYDIRQLALNSMQQGDAYTKDESDQAISEAIAAHNGSSTAHPALQVNMTSLESRIKTLELKFGTSVTGSGFEITFTDLSQLVVTGVWNVEFARVEF
jgi:phage-related tail fiber protein